MPKPRQTCTECSLRRQKCDRRVPCDRCIKRGIPEQCTQSWPEGGGPRSQRMTPRQQTTSRSTPADLPNPIPSDAEAIRVSQDLVEQVTESQRLLAGHNAASIDGPNMDDRRHTADLISDTGLFTWEENLATTFGNGPLLQQWISTHMEDTSDVFQTILPAPGTSSAAILELQLPSVDKIWSLVDYHERYLLWYHGCYHGPTFRRELENAIGQQDTMSIASLNLQWVALLFSIMAGSMACATDHKRAAWGFWKTETPTLSKQWYKATVTCLNIAEYTFNHQIFSVHAITTLSMSAHTLGSSEDLSVLLGAALKIARSLGLDRLHFRPALDNVHHESTPGHRHRVLRREIGRRLWSQLCVQDWFSIPFAESQCISITDFTTTKPSNRDHITMAPLVESFPTYVSYGNFVYDIAKLIAEHHSAMAHSSTPFTKYQQVSEYDTRMRSLARKGLPAYFQVTTPVDETWPEFIPWARRSLTICFAHKIMMIHRKFIKQSFSNLAFQGTRVLCIAASKTILKEVKHEQEESGPIIWIDQACCMTLKTDSTPLIL